MSEYSIKNILVPVDLSENSIYALEVAAFLSMKHKANISVLHVHEPYAKFDSNEDSLTTQKDLNVLSALLDSIENINAIKPELIHMVGNVVESVIATAIGQKADLIVMGTHGASGSRNEFIGSNAYQVIKYAPCPVLTIPGKRKYNTFKRVLFPIRPVTGALMPYDIACHFLSPKSTLTILGLSYLKMQRETAVLDKVVEEIKEKVQRDNVTVKTAWGDHFSISDDIIQFTQKAEPDLFILTSALDAVTKSNFIGPYAQKIINTSRIPILTIKKLGVPVLA